jgi:hypothetical protein
MAANGYTAEETATAQCHFVKTGTGERSCLLNDSLGGQVIGIAKGDLVDGSSVDVYDEDADQALLIMAETCDEGAQLKSNASGHGINLDTNATPENQFYAARALEACTGVGDIIDVRIEKGWKYA